MLYFLVEHTLIAYVQFIKVFKRQSLSLYEKSFENDSEHFVSDSIFKTLFKRLNFDYSSSETVLNQQTKLRAIFLVNACFCRSD